MPRLHNCLNMGLGRRHNTLGFSFSDIPMYTEMTSSAGSYIQESIIDPVKSTAVEYVGEEKIASLSDKLESQIQSTASSFEEQAKAKASTLATEYMQEQMQSKDVQDSGIRAGFDQIANQTIQMKDTLVNEGPLGFAKKYPVTTGVVVTIPTLILLRFIFGKKVLVKANPFNWL